MKILFLHGAIKNAGDFLISNRSQKLIEHIIPNCELMSIWEGEREEEIKKYLPQIDGIVFGGGPFFTHTIHPGDIPLVKDLGSISLPMINIGGGWYGKDNRYKTVSDYYIDETSLELLKKIEDSAGCLSCRDWFTVNMLKEKGFNAEMHGCPAWYDLNRIDTLQLRSIEGINRICVSDPADIMNYETAVRLIVYLKEKYPNAEITFVFHRGTWEKEEGALGEKRKVVIEKTLIDNNICWKDISGSHEGFSIYDSCDLHIGFRVHAHIYNLSMRNRTILLEEDGRGAGVNNALGLSNIHVYDDVRQFKPDLIRKVENRIQPKVNAFVIEDVKRNIERCEYTEWLEYNLAFKRMQFYFEHLKEHISKIKAW